MTITLDTTTENKLAEAAHHAGVSKDAFAHRALNAYLADLQEEQNLQNEFAAWEAASDEDLLAMEQELETDV